MSKAPERIDYAYRALKEGEIIHEKDECLCESKTGWERDSGQCAGKPAPNPIYSSHRLYRRPVRADLAVEQIKAQARKEALEEAAAICNASYGKPMHHIHRDICALAEKENSDGYN